MLSCGKMLRFRSRKERVVGALALLVCSGACDPSGPDATEWSRRLRDGDVVERRRAAEALAESAKDANVDIQTLIDALADSDETVRERVATALMRIGPRAKPALIALHKAIDDKSAMVVESAVLAIRNVGGDDGLQMLIEATRHRSKHVRGACVVAMATVAPPSRGMIDAIAARLSDAEASVRIRAAGTLGVIGRGAASAASDLIAATRDPDSRVRIAAVAGIPAVAPSVAGVVDALAHALEDPIPEVRSMAARSLSRIGGISAMEALIAALGAAEPGVRKEGAFGLGLMGPRAVTSLARLKDLKSDVNEEVRQMADWASLQVAQ